MRVLVTGGAGYIGSQTAKALAQAGHEPIVYDDLSSGHRWAVKWGASVEGDLADTRLLATTLNAHRIEAILHFAASIQVSESVENPRKYFWNNVVNTLRLLDTALDEGVQAIVFSSSAAVYGIPQKVPIPEDHPTRPASPYGETKLMMERALGAYGAAYGIRWVALRYFNAAGADESGEIGELHDPETHLIPLALAAAAPGSAQLQVFGADYPTPDGTCVRDYIHVNDLADAHVRALQHLETGGDSLALNLGTGRGHSVLEVIQAAEAATGCPVRRVMGPRRPGDPPVLVADVAQSQKILGWQATRTLTEIVSSAWVWMQKGSSRSA